MTSQYRVDASTTTTVFYPKIFLGVVVGLYGFFEKLFLILFGGFR